MATETIYEWLLEDVDEYGDVIECVAFERLKDLRQYQSQLDALPLGWHRDVGLARDVICEFDGLTDRCWAYAVDGVLPDTLTGGKQPRRVPKRYAAEWEHWTLTESA